MEYTNKEREALAPWVRCWEPEELDHIVVEQIGIDDKILVFSATKKEYLSLYDQYGEQVWTREGLVALYKADKNFTFQQYFQEQDNYDITRK